MKRITITLTEEDMELLESIKKISKADSKSQVIRWSLREYAKEKTKISYTKNEKGIYERRIEKK